MFKKAIPIAASSDGELTNFQVRITIVKGEGTDSAGVAYLNDEALNWPYDIKFYDSSGNLLDFWRQESDATDGTWIVEVTTIPASTGTTIYLYYGYGDSQDLSDILDAAYCGCGGDFRTGKPSILSYSGTPTVDLGAGLASTLAKTSADATVSATSGKYEAWPAIAKLANGTLLCVYRGKATIHGVDTNGAVYLRKSTDSGRTWGSPITVSDVASYDERDPAILVFMDGSIETVLVLYNAVPASAVDHIKCRKSTDGGSTWGSEIAIYDSYELGCHGNPILLSNGNILLSCYGQVHGHVYVFISEDGGDTWGSPILAIDDETHDTTEPTVLELKTSGSGSYAGKVIIIARSEQSPYKYYQAISNDYGETWGASTTIAQEMPAPTVANPGHLTRLADGKILFVFSYSGDIYLYSSDDECVSWQSWGMLYNNSDAGVTKQYPRLIELTDEIGLVWCTNAASTSAVYFNYYTWPATLNYAVITCNAAEYLESSMNIDRPAVVEAEFQDQNYEGTYKYPFAFGLGSYLATNADHVRREIYTTEQYVLSAGNASGKAGCPAYTKDTSNHIWKIIWYSGEARLYMDADLKGSVSSAYVPSNSIPLRIGRTYYSNAGCKANFKWFFVRKYTANEPVVGTPVDAPISAAGPQIIGLRRR